MEKMIVPDRLLEHSHIEIVKSGLEACVQHVFKLINECSPYPTILTLTTETFNTTLYQSTNQSINQTINLILTSELRLLGRLTLCLAKTTTASRLLFALTWHFVPRKCKKKLEIIDFEFLFKFCTIIMT